MAFKHCISFATDWAANFVVMDSESRLTSFPSFCAPPSEVAVLFYSNLSRRPFLGQVVDFDLLLCTGFYSEHSVLFLCHIFTQRPMTGRKIERSKGRCLGRQQLLDNSIENSFQMVKKSDLSRPVIYKALKPGWLLKWVSIARVVACFPQASPSQPATVAELETPCVCARPSNQRKQSRRAAPRAWQLILPSKPSITVWNNVQRDCQMTGWGSNLDSNLNSAAQPTSCKEFFTSEITA